MKKTLKVFLFFMFAFILFSLGKGVQANTIKKISMDIYIEENGDAKITETWTCNTSSGTEVYHPYYNLGNSEIKNLSVSEGTKKYTTLSKWNTSGTLSSKAEKCGINKISNGVELCWGISSYGSHTYKVSYTITKFVSELKDSQMIYWTLIPYDFSTAIGEVYIKIYTNFKISDTTDVWGYGNYGGTAYVYNGYIEMQSDGKLSTSEYMTILVKFPSGTFKTTNKLNYNFQHYYDMAEEGSTKYVKSSSSSSSSSSGSTISSLFSIIFNLAIWGAIIWGIVKFGTLNNNSINFGVEGKKIPKDVPYYRDIPWHKDLFRSYFIAYQYGLTKKKTDVLGAIILKWLKEGLIRIEQKETGMVFKKENTVVVLTELNPSVLEDEKEKELFKMLYEASKDGYLENKEFEKWCSKCYTRILYWFDNIISREKEKLVEYGLIIVEDTFKAYKNKKYTATSALKREAIELAGLKRYLNEYTLIKDREAIEVKLFEEYLIYAQIMGIAKKVATEFKNLYPEIIEQSNFNSYDNIIFIHTCSTRGISQANVAKSRAESYSSGGGGFSSGGGGGGSFGGGGGGGGFR